ncbi:MAG: ABC transporter permease [Candidatus Woesearchaeota archaeon]
MLKEYLSLSFENLKRRGIRSWLTMLGIFIGIAAVVSLISLGQGLENAVGAQFQALGADRITIQATGLGFGPPGQSVVNPLTNDDLQVIRRVQGVEEAGARLLEQVTIQRGQNIRTTFLVSLPEDTNQRRFINDAFNYEIELGRDITPQDTKKIVVGYSFYERERVGSILRPRDKILIQGEEFEVAGVYKRTGSFQVDGSIVTNENDMRDLLNIPNRVSIITARVSNVDQIDEVTERIRRDLRRQRNVELGREDFQVQTSQQTLESISTILTAITIVIVGIASISLLVGGIGIMNTMYTSVLERTKEIGIMKAIGAKNSDIFTLFFIESGLLGLAGGIIGIILGVTLAKLVEIGGRLFLGTNLLQANFTLELILGSLIFSFIVGTLAGTLPARGASKLKPVDALRK